MFSNNRVTLRKLNGYANSVIIVDEFQGIPQHLLQTTLEALRELVRRYNCIVLFVSATPPNFSLRKGLEWFDDEVNSIVKNVDELYAKYGKIKKINVVKNKKPYSSNDLVKECFSKSNSCCIVNTKKQARVLFNELIKMYPYESCYLITTDLCSIHRNTIVSKIKERQREGQPVRVVATQCIDAGVDFLPVSYDIFVI